MISSLEKVENINVNGVLMNLFGEKDPLALHLENRIYYLEEEMRMNYLLCQWKLHIYGVVCIILVFIDKLI